MLGAGRRGTEVGKNQRANPALMILITVQSHSSLAATSYFWPTSSSPFLSTLLRSKCGKHVSCQSYGRSIYSKECFISQCVSRQKWLKCFACQLLRSFVTLRFASFSAFNPLGISSPTLSSPSPLSLCIIHFLRLHPYSFQQMDVIYRHTGAVKPHSEHSLHRLKKQQQITSIKYN